MLTSVKHQSTVREVPAHYPVRKRRQAPASMLAEHGVKRSRLEILWGELSVDEKFQDLTEFDATLFSGANGRAPTSRRNCSSFQEISQPTF